MLAVSLHPEDIRATLRKRHGTLARFAGANGLTKQHVADFLRGRTSARVLDVIEAELQAARAEEQSIELDDSADQSVAHRLNAGER